MGVIWAAYKAGSLPQIPEGIEQEEFAQIVTDWLARFQSSLIIEDYTKAFKSGRGPVAMIVVANDGEIIKPFGLSFTWATVRNKLRSLVSFLQMVKYSSDVGLCVLYGTFEEDNILQRQRRYGHNLWHVGNGIWCLPGRKKNPRR